MTTQTPGSSAAHIGLVGRDVELAALHAAFEATVGSNQAQVVVVSGEAGLGKTRLLQTFTDNLASDDRRPICGYGQALSIGVATEAFGAVRECLRSIVASKGQAKPPHLRIIGKALKESAPAWLEAIPMVGQLLSAGVQTTHAISQGRGATAIDLASPVDQFLAFVQTLTADAPVVLVLDDLHWADNATIELVMRLALRGVGPLLLVLSYRVTPGASPTAADRAILEARNNILRYKENARTIDLKGLPDRSLLRALAGRLAVDGRQLEPRKMRRIIHLSGGNPLVAECLSLTADHGDSASLSHGNSPSRIGAIMDIGLSRLDPSESRFLEACATVGPIFDATTVAHALSLTPDDVLDQIDSLVMKAPLIDDVPGHRGAQRYRFHHPILAEVLRDRAKEQTNRWRRINGRLVDAASRFGSDKEWDAALLARMAGYAVEAQRDEEAFGWALAASRKQLILGSSSTALETARAAVACAGTSARLLEARTVLIDCLQSYGDHDEVVAVCEAALSDLDTGGLGNDDAQEFSLRLQRLRGLRMLGEWPAVIADLNLLIADPATDGTPQETQALLLLAEIQLCGPKQDLVACWRTLDKLNRLELDVATKSRATGHLGLVALAKHDPVAANKFLDDAIELGRLSNKPFDLYEAIHWKSKKQIACLELEPAARSIRLLQEISERHGIAGDTPFHDRDLSRVLGLMGETTEASRLCVRYADSSGSRDGVVISTIAFQMAELQELKGRSAADTVLAEFLRFAPGDMYDSARRELASRTIDVLTRTADLVAVAKDAAQLGVSVTDHRNAFSVFTFNVPRLDILRSRQ